MAGEIREAVLDASILVQTVIKESHTSAALALLKDLESIHTPSLALFDVGNVLAMLVHREVLRPGDALRKFDLLANLPMIRVRNPPWSRAMKIAIERRMTLYDASYVALAAEDDLPLVTADKELCRKAEGAATILHASELGHRGS